MISRNEYQNGIWVDLEQPGEEEIRSVVKEFSISKQFEKEMISPTPTQVVTTDGTMMLLVLHFPAHGAKNGDTGNQEIDFIVSNNFIVTVHYEVVAPIFHLKKLLEAQTFVNGDNAITTDVLIEVIFAHLYTSVRDHTDNIVNKLIHTEKAMFDGQERMTIRSISNINREFLHMEATIANQEGPLNHFLKEFANNNSFGPVFDERIGRILSERTQVSQLITTHRAIAAELRETNTALLGARQNEIMKTLTIVNFIFLPLGLISWIFSMRTEGTPIVDLPNAFWIVLSIMSVIAIVLTAFFIKKRWLF